MKNKNKPSRNIFKFLGKYIKRIYLFFGIYIKKIKSLRLFTITYLGYLEVMYKIHLRIRYGHDVAYKNVKIYKKYTDNPLSKTINHATLYSFVFSTIIFLSFQFGLPGIFNFFKAGDVLAKFDGVVWTKKSDFGAGNTNIQVTGLNSDSDSSISLKSTQDFGSCGEECGTVNVNQGGTQTLSYANTTLAGSGVTNNIQENSSSIVKSGTWVDWADASHSGGNALKTTGNTGEISYTYTSKEYVAIYATKHTGAGSVSIKLNGTQVATVDLNTPQVQACIVWSNEYKCAQTGPVDNYLYQQKVYEIYPSNPFTTDTLTLSKLDTGTTLPVNVDFIQERSAYYFQANGSAKTLTVASASGFAVGQKVLIAQMSHNNRADYLALPNGGQEEAKITAINGNNIEFESPLINNYYSDTNSKVQVLQIKEYWDLTISNNTVLSAPAWNGSTGGIFSIKVANNLQIDAGSKIDMTGFGYRTGEGPGAGNPGTCYYGSTGGAYGGNGGASGVVVPLAYGSETNNSYMGSGGANAQCSVGVGGAGGGYIKLGAKNINLNGSIQSNGKGASGRYVSGGAGGGINILTYSINNNGKISAAGGGGGDGSATQLGGQDGLNGIGGSGTGQAGGGPGSPPGNGGSANGNLSVAPGPSAGGSGYTVGGGGGGAAGRISFGYTWFNGTQVGPYNYAAVQDSDSNLVKTGTWSNWANAGHSGGTAARTSGNSGEITYSVTGTELFEYYASTHSGAGVVEVLVNGVSKGIFDLNVPQIPDTVYNPVCKCEVPTGTYSDAYNFNQKIFSIDHLQRSSNNTITIRKSDTGTTKPINLDYFRISTSINNTPGYADARFSSNSVGPYGYYTFLTPFYASGTIGALTGGDLAKLANNGAKVMPVSIEANFDGDPLVNGNQGLVNGQAVKILLRASNDNSTWTTYAKDGSVVSNVDTAFADQAKYWGQTYNQSFASTVSGIGNYSYFALIIRLEGTGESSLVLNDVTLKYNSLEEPNQTNVYLTKLDGTTKLKNNLGAEVATAQTAGAITNEGSARVYTSGLTCNDCNPAPTNIWTQVEVKPVGTPFNDSPADIYESLQPADSYTTIQNLVAGQSYHIRVRAVDSNARVSAWTEVGSADVNEADIRVDQTIPTATTVKANNDAPFATSETRILNISGIFNNVGATAENMEIQFSQDGTNWGVYSGTGDINNKNNSWQYSKMISHSDIEQTVSAAWYMEGSDALDVPIYVRVRDFAGNVSTFANDTITLDTLPPNAPTGLLSYASDGGALLDPNTWYGHTAPYFNWADNSEPDLSGYKYCYSQNQSCTPTEDISKTESYKLIDISNNTTYPDGSYYFRVLAYDMANNVSGITQILYKTDKKVPGAVTGYRASQNNETTVVVAWNPVSQAGGSQISYVLERIPYLTYYENGYNKEDQPGKIWSNLATYKAFAPTISTSITEYVSEDVNIANRLIGGVKYVYRIRAYDETGKFSAYQNDIFAGLTRDGTDPLPPSGVNVNGCSYQNPEYCQTTDDNLKGHQAVVRWSPGSDAGTGIVGYEIYRTTGNPVLEADYSLVGSVSVANPLPVMDQYNSLVYYDNNLSDYTIYHYRVVAVDGAADETYPANRSRIVKNVNDFGNYANVTTPDITAPSAPMVSIAASGLDDPASPNPKQKVILTWSPSIDTGIGIKTYRVYKANRYDATDQSGQVLESDYVDITDDPSVSCTFESYECFVSGLEDVSFYYFRMKAIDNDPFNNVSEFSNIATIKTLSSAVPTPPRGRKDSNTQLFEQFPYVYSTKGATSSSAVGDEIKVTFSGSYVKDEQPYIARYEVYRSLDKLNWIRIGGDILPIRNDNDTDNQYTITDNNLVDATKYYYRVRAVGNNPGIEGGGESYSGIGNSQNQGWDFTPDTTAPALPADLKVKDIHDDGVSYKRNIITWARIADPIRNGANDFKEYRIYRSIDGIVWTQIKDEFGNNPLYHNDLDKTAAENQQINMATNYYMDLIPNAEANRYYYYYVTAVDNASDFVYPNTQTKINNYSNESNPPRDADNRIISVSLNPAIAKPTIATVGALAPKLTNIGVSSATVEWYADQDTDSVVEFKAVNDPKWITIGDRVVKRYNEAHSVRLFGLNPKTEYEYKIISRNYLGNEDVVGDNEPEKVYLPKLITSEFNVSGEAAITTTSTAEVTWKTNLDASSAFIEYQLNRSTGDDAQGGTAGVEPGVLASSPKSHKVVVKGLRSNRTYTYKIKSISTDGFITETQFLTFKTKNFDSDQFTIAPSSSNVAERQITSTTAQIVWQTSLPGSSWVDYSTTSGKYETSAGNDNPTLQHVVVVEGLVPGTTYYYRVRSKDENELEYTSQEYSFKAILKPKISNMKVKDVTPYSVTISWDTNVETETLINWGKTAAYGEKKGVSGVSKVHEVKVANLEDNQEYHYQILAKDEAGNEVSDEDKIIRTPLDTEGPKIENVKLDVLPMGEADATGQVIVSWSTNKPATTQVEYDEGVIGGKYALSTVEDNSLNTSHTVIIKDLKPATSYHYRIVSKDKRLNTTLSQDFTFVTPTKEKSILQLIIKSLEDTFAWTRNLNQFFGNVGKRFTGN